jgi:hypothetical protein
LCYLFSSLLPAKLCFERVDCQFDRFGYRDLFRLSRAQQISQAQNLIAQAFSSFDLLWSASGDLRKMPLEERKAELREMLSGTDGLHLRCSESFDDANKLLEEAIRLGLEGDRLQKPRFTLSLRILPKLDQGQNRPLARC